MHCFVCVDDTDMPGTAGTGRLLQKICGELEQEGMGMCSPISRHQLFVHEDIPFTSHNSAMCVEVQLAETISLPPFTAWMAERLEILSQEGSDPGLCVAASMGTESQKQLIAFGQKAKKAVLNKDEALELARDLDIHLSEHGGTGQGVIGALAGLGLRLSGNDGRYRGWCHLGGMEDVFQVGDLCRLPFIDRVVTLSGAVLMPDERVRIGSEKTKTVRLGHGQVVVAVPDKGGKQPDVLYRTFTKEEARQY